jgi:hypothetical protein
MWFRWVAPRDGRFLWRTLGSEVFNEVSVYRHTGTTPPPLIAFSDTDLWASAAAISSAVEVLVEKDVEYSIRVASASDGWIVLDHGPPKPVIQDDGWSINESERATRSRVSAVGVVSGLAVEDDQVAAASNGAGADPTLDGVELGDIGVIAFVRGIVRVRGTGSGSGVWHIGQFVNGVQRAHRAFVSKTWETLEFPVIQVDRGDRIDVRLYRLSGEASAPAQIAEWRLESLSQVGCNPYSGGPLEGGTSVTEDPSQDELNARFIAHLNAVESGGTEDAPIMGENNSNYVDPSEWSPAPDDPDPPWDSTNDPLNPGPSSDFLFQPFPPP